MVNIPSFLEQENNSIKEDASLNAFKTHQRYRTNKKPSQTKSAQPDLFCRVCMIAGLPKEIYTSHDPMDEKCTSLSSTDKKIVSFVPRQPNRLHLHFISHISSEIDPN